MTALTYQIVFLENNFEPQRKKLKASVTEETYFTQPQSKIEGNMLANTALMKGKMPLAIVENNVRTHTSAFENKISLAHQTELRSTLLSQYQGMNPQSQPMNQQQITQEQVSLLQQSVLHAAEQSNIPTHAAVMNTMPVTVPRNMPCSLPGAAPTTMPGLIKPGQANLPPMLNASQFQGAPLTSGTPQMISTMQGQSMQTGTSNMSLAMMMPQQSFMMPGAMPGAMQGIGHF